MLIHDLRRSAVRNMERAGLSRTVLASYQPALLVESRAVFRRRRFFNGRPVRGTAIIALAFCAWSLLSVGWSVGRVVTLTKSVELTELLVCSILFAAALRHRYQRPADVAALEARLTRAPSSVRFLGPGFIVQNR